MRQSRPIATVCVAAAAAVVLLAASAAAAAAASPSAARALQYLAAQQSAANGSIPSSPGSYAPTELYVIAAAAAGENAATLRHGSGPSALQYLQLHVADACSSAGKCGELIQAVVAARENPHDFGGKDLVAAVGAAYHVATGAYGDGEAFTQALAIQGLIAAGAPVPAGAVHYIVNAQDRDGGWDFLDKPNDTNPKDQASSDTNSTAMSLMALDAAGNHSRDASALDWLRAQEDPDGGFPYQAGAGGDPDSTALVVQALVAAHQDPSVSTRGGPSPLAYLTTTQTAGGGYIFPGSTKPDAFTTSQVPLALLQRALPYVPPVASTAPPHQPSQSASTPSFVLPLVIVLVIVLLATGGVVLARRR